MGVVESREDAAISPRQTHRYRLPFDTFPRRGERRGDFPQFTTPIAAL